VVITTIVSQILQRMIASLEPKRTRNEPVSCKICKEHGMNT